MHRVLEPVSQLLLLTLATPVLAQMDLCPTGTAMAEKGIDITYDDGSRSHTVLDAATGDTAERFSYADGFTMQSDLMMGLHTTRLVEVDGTGAEIPGTDYIYSYTAPRPDALTAGLVWQSPFTVVNGAESYAGTYRMTVGQPSEAKIGSCSYASLPVTMFSDDGTYKFLVQADHLPDLGISVLRGFGEMGGETTAVTPIDIVASP